MSQQLIILEEDKKWAMARIAALDEDIQALGPEFHDVFNQSSETWHDNAPFDALRDRQSVLDAERQQLKHVLRRALPAVPPQRPGRIGVGSLAEVVDEKERIARYFVAGDWTARAGQLYDGAIIMSARAPLASLLMGKKRGELIYFRGRKIQIISVEARSSHI